MKKPKFKPYHNKQMSLIPLDLNEMVAKDHIVRHIDLLVDELDTTELEKQYKGGGTTAYHPVMMLKIVLYAYSQRIFSSRRIAKAARENIHFLWISRMNRPDFRTINRFRSVVMRPVIEDLFYQLADKLVDLGLVDLEKYFIDGTKMEANAHKYSFVWKKSVENYKEKLQASIRLLFDEIEEIQEWEDGVYGDKDLNEVEGAKNISAADLEKVAKELNETLKKRLAKQEEKELKKLKKN